MRFEKKTLQFIQKLRKKVQQLEKILKKFVQFRSKSSPKTANNVFLSLDHCPSQPATAPASASSPVFAQLSPIIYIASAPLSLFLDPEAHTVQTTPQFQTLVKNSSFCQTMTTSNSAHCYVMLLAVIQQRKQFEFSSDSLIYHKFYINYLASTDKSRKLFLISYQNPSVPSKR